MNWNDIDAVKSLVADMAARVRELETELKSACEIKNMWYREIEKLKDEIRELTEPHEIFRHKNVGHTYAEEE